MAVYFYRMEQVQTHFLIKKYDSTSYLRIAQVLKWLPIHKVEEQLPEKPSRGAQYIIKVWEQLKPEELRKV